MNVRLHDRRSARACGGAAYGRRATTSLPAADDGLVQASGATQSSHHGCSKTELTQGTEPRGGSVVVTAGGVSV